MIARRRAALALLTFLLILTQIAEGAPALNGMALHVQLSKDQFIAALYLATPTTNSRDALINDEDKAMELRILTNDLYARRFQRMWIEGIAINAGSAELERHAQHLADFSNLLKFKLMAGDILRIERVTGRNATRVSLNGHLLDSIADKQFFDLLLRSWLGPVPLSSDFKENLLAAGTVNPELAGLFNATSPSPARIAEVASATTPPPVPPTVPTLEPPTTSTTPPSVAENRPADAPAQPQPQPQTEEPQAPPPKPEQLVTEASLFENEEIFADEEQEGYSFTAEDLLSEQIYIAKLTKWTGNFVSYPRAALRNSHEGTVRLTVTLARDGRVRDVQILEKAEHESLNKAAAKAVKSASPYPAIPDAIKGDQFIFTVPVVFRLN